MNTNMRTIYTIGASLIFLRLNTFLYVKLKLYIRCLKVRLQTTTKICTSWNWSKQASSSSNLSTHSPTRSNKQITSNLDEESRQLHPEFLMWWLGNLNRTVPLIGRTYASITTQRQTDTSSSQVIRCGISPNTCMLGEYSLCPTTIVVLAQYLSDQVHKEVHVSSHIDVQVQTCNDAPGSELRRQRQRDGGSSCIAIAHRTNPKKWSRSTITKILVQPPTNR